MPTTPRVLVALAAATSMAHAGPDLIVSDISGANHYGEFDGVRVYALGVTSCNLGDESVNWFETTPDHPVTAQSLYRLSEDGRLRQIGISHVAHAFAALQTGGCSTCQPGGDFQHLGPGCASPSSAGLTGAQAYLGRRSEVNASTGVIQFPFTGIGEAGPSMERRIQAPSSEIIASGTYFAELQHIAQDDASAGGGLNNASYRGATVAANGSLQLTGSTVTGLPAIFAWGEIPGVQVVSVDVPGDGRLHVGSNVTEIAPGEWRYDYAVHNLNSHRSVGSVRVPGAGAVTGAEFQAPLYHSGEPVDNEPWAFSGAGGDATWSVPAHTPATDLTANAVRWGTMYTFSFVAQTPPTMGSIELGLFRPGLPGSVMVSAPVPANACVADFAEPFGTLDFSDVAGFLSAFGTMSVEADLAEPFGTHDFSDVAAFLASFGAGCP
ncbi:MAG: GC-type dockerin domain-anchored protein [Phycisphaerales bacterium JB059]